jgi:hypothetical protein
MSWICTTYTMHRRHFLRLAAMCGTATPTGCLSDGPDDAAGASTPAGTGSSETTDRTGGADDGSLVGPVESLWTAYNEADIDGMQAAFHPDSSARPAEDGVHFEGEVTIDSTTVLERGDESVTVEAHLVYETDADRSERTDTYELRRHEGRWVIWSQSVRGGDAADGPVPPLIAFEFEYDTAATDGSDTGVLTVTHSAGDSVDSARLSIGGSGIVAVDGVDTDVTTPDTNWGDATGAEDVSAGTSITVGARSDCQVSVIWESEDGAESSVLAAYDGPDA